MQRLLRMNGFLPLVLVAFMNAFVDLGHKVVIQNTVFKVYDGALQVALTGLVNALILLPFVALMSPAGFIADRFAKPRVMRHAAAAAVIVTLLITACYHLGWFWAAFALTFVLAVQSAVYGPAKLGYLKELAGVEELAAANGVLQAASTGAILTGMLAFSFGFEFLIDGARTASASGAVLTNIAPLGWCLVAGAALEYLLTLRLPIVRDDDPSLSFDFARYRSGGYLRETLGALWSRPVLRLSVIGLGIFWSIAQVLVAVYPTFAESFLGLSNVAMIQLVMAAASVGVVLGSLAAAALSRAHIETGFIPLGALGVAACLVLLPGAAQAPMQGALFLALGAFGALFIVPLNALVQFNAGEHELGRVLAASALVNNVLMIGFLALTVVFALGGFDERALLGIITLVAAGGALYTVLKLPQSLVRVLMSRLFAVRYRLEVTGMEHVPRSGGVLLLGNHVSWIDWAVVAMASPRPVRFVMARGIYERWYLRWFLDFVGVIPIATGRAQQSLRDIGAHLAAGEVVCLFPEGAISRHGQLNEFKRGFERAAANAGEAELVIVPFYLRGLWGSQFSYAAQTLKTRPARGPRRTIGVAFGPPMAPTSNATSVKQAVAELSIVAWEAHAATLPSLPLGWLTGARRDGGAIALVESTGTRLTRSALACRVLTLAPRIRRRVRSRAVGIALPPGADSASANLAALLAGRTVVNLDATTLDDDLLRRAGVDTLITSRRYRASIAPRDAGSSAGAACETLLLEDLEAGRGRARRACAWLMLRLLPATWLVRLNGADLDADRTAAIVFSRGRRGTPKAVRLSHRSVYANLRQITDMLNPTEHDVVVGCLPASHAFGLTVTTLLPLVEGLPLLTHPAPEDALGVARAVYRYDGTLLFLTSGLLPGYLDDARVQPLMLESLRLVIAGGGRLDAAVRESFVRKFRKTVYEGYGTTETTPVASVNVPDYLDGQNWKLHAGHKEGTVGMPLPGSSFRIVDPLTHAALPPGQDGLVLIGGVQLMQGYVDDVASTAAALLEIDGRRWFNSGDHGHLDDDGFLTLAAP